MKHFNNDQKNNYTSVGFITAADCCVQRSLFVDYFDTIGSSIVDSAHGISRSYAKTSTEQTMKNIVRVVRMTFAPGCSSTGGYPGSRFSHEAILDGVQVGIAGPMASRQCVFVRQTYGRKGRGICYPNMLLGEIKKKHYLNYRHHPLHAQKCALSLTHHWMTLTRWQAAPYRCVDHRGIKKALQRIAGKTNPEWYQMMSSAWAQTSKRKGMGPKNSIWRNPNSSEQECAKVKKPRLDRGDCSWGRCAAFWLPCHHKPRFCVVGEGQLEGGGGSHTYKALLPGCFDAANTIDNASSSTM